jgi:hypothetical protein
MARRKKNFFFGTSKEQEVLYVPLEAPVKLGALTSSLGHAHHASGGDAGPGLGVCRSTGSRLQRGQQDET